ncbi:hypothetical protein E3Q11_03588 [Wallemia mellicola]|nr:hypothetical protein E3Q11_03588 [Wallemia mellicola]
MKSIDLGFTPRSRVRYIGTRKERMKESEGDIHKDLGWSAFFELLTNLRGVGWEWGYTLDKLPEVYYHNFCIKSIIDALKHLFISAISVGILTHAMDNNDSLAIGFGFRQTASTQFASDVVQTIALAAAAWSGLSLGYRLIALTVFSVKKLTRSRFDVERWPCLLQDPLQMTSIHDFWSNKWHALFKRQFVVCGYKPILFICKRLGIKGDLASLLGMQGAFFVSGLLHEYGIRNALNDVKHPNYYPSMLFFQLSAVAIGFELLFERLTKRKISGISGRVWAWTFLIITAIPLMKHWLHEGRLGYIVPPRLWTWQRIITPFGFLAKAGHL